MDYTDHDDRNPATAELLEDAYVSPIDVETAARHLWVIHTEAARLRTIRAVLPARGTRNDCAAAQSVDRRRSGADRRVSSPSRRRTMPRALAPLLAIMMMLSTSGVALAASQRSLPGDVLYAVKRGTESAQLVFARSPSARAQLQLAFAENRLEEIRKVGDSRPDRVPALVADIDMSLSEVDRSAPESAPDSERIRRQTTDQIAQLSLPAEVTKAVEDVISTSPPPPAVVAQAPVTDPSRGALSASPRVAPSTQDDVAGPAPVVTVTDGPPAEPETALPQEEDAIEQSDEASTADEIVAPGEGREVAVEESARPDDSLAEENVPTPVPPSAAAEPPPVSDEVPSVPTPTTEPVTEPSAQPVPTPRPTPTPVGPPPATPTPTTPAPTAPPVTPPAPPTLDVDVIVDGKIVPSVTSSATGAPTPAYDTTQQTPVAPAVAPAR
ncbi:hypothetical protein BH24ACT15_BH24ACT15_04990 [soil metagenome]